MGSNTVVDSTDSHFKDEGATVTTAGYIVSGDLLIHVYTYNSMKEQLM